MIRINDIFQSRLFFVFHFDCCIEMAGGGVQDNPNLKGLSRIFNAETNFGRANVRIIIIRLHEYF